MDEDALLARVGERVRGMRALRGVSRKMLADRAEVSERHLAMVEKGAGNVSLRLLGRIAGALGVEAGELLQAPETPQIRLVTELLARLTAEQQLEVYRLLAEAFPQGVVHRRIALVGLRGAGKTTLGTRLAEVLGVPFVRLSSLIEAGAGMSMSEIHELLGQPGYRRLEERAVEDAMARYDAGVFEAGGSIVANVPAYQTLLREARVVWIKASPAEHMNRVIEQGDLRPMAGREDAMEDLLAILEQRAQLYANAHATLDTSGRALEDCIAELVEISNRLSMEPVT